MNNKVEYKKINYVMSIYQSEKEKINSMSFNESSQLFIIKLIKHYNESVKSNVKFQKTNVYENLITIDEVKSILNGFYNSIPSSLMILRNHLKSCLYGKDLKSIEYWYKEVDKDIERLKLIK